MSETVKLRTFCGQPMEDKGVDVVPGVGKIAARKLKSMDYTKASDLYNRLKRLNFDEKKFRVWIKINCKGAKVATIYKALMGWHSQFGGTETNGSEESPRPPSPRARPVPVGRGGRTPLTAPRRPRTSVQFNLPGTERNPDSPVNSIPQNNHPLSLFFASFSLSYIAPQYHNELKMEILNIMSKYERRSMGWPSPPQANGM